MQVIQRVERWERSSILESNKTTRR